MEELGLEVKQLVNFLESTLTPCEDGLTMVTLNLKQLLVVRDYIFSLLKLPLRMQNLRKKMLCMLEFHLQSKRMTWRDKSPMYLLDTHVLELLETLGQVLTLNEEDLSNCWKNYLKEAYEELWLPAKTDFAGLDLTCLNGTLKRKMLNSWFSIKLIKPQNKNSLKTYLPFYKCLLADGTEKETTVLRSRKIRLQLNSLQIKELDKHRNNHRYSQNKAIYLLNQLNEKERTIETRLWKRRTKEDHYCKHTSKKGKVCNKNFCYKHNPEYEKQKEDEGEYNYEGFYSKNDIRNLVTPELVNSRTPWLLETPKSIRENGVFRAVENRKTCFTNLANGNIKKFNQRFISKRNPTWTMGGIEARTVQIIDKNTLQIFPKLNLGYFKTKESLPREVKHDCSIHFDGSHYYFIIPMDFEIKNNSDKKLTISADPGVREFLCFYDGSEQEVISVGDQAATSIYKLLIKIDKLISAKSKAKCKPKKLIVKKIKKARLKIQNLQRELHWKTANWLCSNYTEVVIPHFGSKAMSKKKKRKIRCKTVRQMMVLGHCKFLDKLKTKAQEYNTKITIVNEINTTKRCGNCNHLQPNVNSKKEWRCSKCSISMLRDANAARNISRKVLDFGLEW